MQTQMPKTFVHYGPEWSESFLRSLPMVNRRTLLDMLATDRLDIEGWARRIESWRFQARPSQFPPPGEWRCWLFVGGRGAGKTRAGAEWLREQIEVNGMGRAALVAPTLHDAREVMIEGVSGLRAIGPEEGRPVYVASRRRLEWPNGATAQVFSAEDPDSLRGPQFDVAWCDEVAAWTYDETAWDMLMLGLRLGDDPRVVATTTPRPRVLVKRLLKEKGVVVTRSATSDNRANLSAAFLETVEGLYGGKLLGRQELEGELVETLEGALWRLSEIDALRSDAPIDGVVKTVLALDPPAGKGGGADACGAVVAGKTASGEAVILADGTTQGLAPLDWAGRAAALARRWGAAEIVAEANQGGEMVRDMLKLAGWTGAVRLVHARFGKMMRAQPVAALYNQGRVRHAGAFRELEDEMCTFGADGLNHSPDRVDALVWAVSTLLLEGGAGPRIRRT